jgi:hypothetical protein
VSISTLTWNLLSWKRTRFAGNAHSVLFLAALSLGLFSHCVVCFANLSATHITDCAFFTHCVGVAATTFTYELVSIANKTFFTLCVVIAIFSTSGLDKFFSCFTSRTVGTFGVAGRIAHMSNVLLVGTSRTWFAYSRIIQAAILWHVLLTAACRTGRTLCLVVYATMNRNVFASRTISAISTFCVSHTSTFSWSLLVFFTRHASFTQSVTLWRLRSRWV